MARLIEPEAVVTATIWLEARGEPQEGRIAVAEVIRNRTAAKFFSDGTPEGTCLRPWQFSAWNTETQGRGRAMQLDSSDPIVAQCLAAWLAAQSGSNIAQGALLYHSTTMNPYPKWSDTSRFLVEIGLHRFYVPIT